MPELRNMPALETKRYGKVINQESDNFINENNDLFIRDEDLPYHLPEMNGCFKKCYNVYLNFCENFSDFSDYIVDNHLIC